MEIKSQQTRLRDLGIQIGIMQIGENNAITDVPGVKVGHTTIIKRKDIRTGVTAILPHSGNIFQEKVPAAIYIGNGFGKLAGYSQVEELGNLETPIILTNTLSVPVAVKAVMEYTLELRRNKKVRSVNPVVGETNDGRLNNIRKMYIKEKHIKEAIKVAETGVVAEGNVGAGTGTICFGFKGGIGTSSRVLPESRGGYTVGVLVQSNFGGVLEFNGVPIGREMGQYYLKDAYNNEDGSCMMVLLTDAPVNSRNLKRMAKRAMMGLAKTGGIASNGSGDYVIAASTHRDCRISYDSAKSILKKPELRNNAMSPLFLAVIEATEEAILNSLVMAEDMKGHQGSEVKAIPVSELMKIMKKYNKIKD